MGIVTDSIPLEEPKDPDACNVFKLYELVASDNAIQEMRANYQNGGYGYGHAKKELLAALLERFAEPRAAFDQYMENPEEIISKLEFGASKARTTASATLKRVRQSLGFRA